MSKKYEVKHLDSNIIIAAFFPDHKDMEDELSRYCNNFLSQVLKNEPNTKLRVSLVAYGEILHKMLNAKDESIIQEGFRSLNDFKNKMEKKFELYSPKFNGPSEHLDDAISKLKQVDKIKGSDADTLILAYAMVDGEASSLYTVDGILLNNQQIEEQVIAFRKGHGLRKLHIKSVYRSKQK